MKGLFCTAAGPKSLIKCKLMPSLYVGGKRSPTLCAPERSTFKSSQKAGLKVRDLNLRSGVCVCARAGGAGE